MVVIVFLLVTKQTRTQCLVARCRGDRVAAPQFHHGSVIHLHGNVTGFRTEIFRMKE